MCRDTAIRLIALLIATSVVASDLPDVHHQRLPSIIVDANAQQITNRERCVVTIRVANEDSTVETLAELSIRGSSSAKRDKKPYRLELQDENGDDLKLSLLGMPKESDWILYPAHTDKTMIRDVLAYELWRQMGYWAPRTRYVHLFLRTNSSSSSFSSSNLVASSLPSRPSVENSSVSSNAFASIRVISGQSPSLPSVKPDSPSALSASSVFNSNFASFRAFSGDTPGYEGVYVLMEKIKRGKHRVNIQKLPRSSSSSLPSRPSVENDSAFEASVTSASSCSNDLSGGYIFKKDRHNNTNETPFRTSKKVDLIIEEPKARDLTPDQLAWFTNHINEFESALFSGNFADPSTGYARYIDVDSFVDYHWMQEFGKNADGYWFSEFYHKDRGGKIKIGPLWDFDMCFGNTWYNAGYLTNNWRWTYSASHNYRWYQRMFKDPEFLQRYIDRWSELRTSVLSTSNVLALIDRFAAEIAEAQKLNYQRWPTLGKKIGPVFFVGQTWEEEVQYLKDWMVGRLAWIDSQDFPKPVLTVIPPSDSLSRPFASFAGNSGLLSVSSASLPSLPSVETNSALCVSPSVRPSTINYQPSTLAITCQPGAGSIFYTTNNTDPRVPGGHVSTNAIHYTAPIPITPGLQVRARVMSDYGLWSAPALFP